MTRFVLPLAILTASAASLQANVTLPALFSDHMVLQRGVPATVWGWADKDEDVSVSIAGQTKSTKANADGKWRLKLDPLTVGEPQTMTVKGKNAITINDVLVGEVWLCSGQSNMGFHVMQADNFPAEKEAATHPKLRMFTEASGAATQPQDHGRGTWIVCSPETVGPFSATAYFFGRELHDKLGVPVGLVHSSVGGTPIEAWTSLEAQKDVPQVKFIFDDWEKRTGTWDPAKASENYNRQKAEWQEAADKAKANGTKPPTPPRAPVDPRVDIHRPANLFNGKIAPLIPYTIRGAVWYQGESNADTIERGRAYATQLPLLVADWRKRWGYDFPVAWVQLPEFQARSSDGWSLVREAMMKSLSIPHTGMAIALGLGTVHNIHPPHKQEVGKRVAAWALSEVYGEKTPSSGPIYASNHVDGSNITITFTHADGGLAAKDGTLKGFTIAGEDKSWKPAVAKIDGNKVIVSTPDGSKAVAVRYAWGSNPEFSLTNGAGLPASPFRTDNWEISPTAPVAPASQAEAPAP